MTTANGTPPAGPVTAHDLELVGLAEPPVCPCPACARERAGRNGHAEVAPTPPGPQPELAEDPGHEAAGHRQRVVVYIRPDEHLVTEETVAALAARGGNVYQHGGHLVQVVRDSRPVGPPGRGGLTRPAGAPRLAAVPPAKLRGELAAAAQFMGRKEKNGRVVVAPVHPPDWLVKAVDARADWPGVRHLEAVTEAPLLRPDGSVLQRPGYDPATGLLYDPADAFPPVPDAPTHADAIRARDALLEPLADFPFATDAHKAAALAALLTPLARFAFDGPAPLFFITANTRGTGKGLLADVLATVAFGRPFARAAYSRDDDEMRKVILALALEGERAVLLDNVAGTFGGPALDAALTSVEWSGRVLGQSRQARLPLLATWYATANNPIVGADTARRVCECRLESPEERPEERAGFRHPDLLAWVRQERPRLLAAALTILSAYCRAGRPELGLRPWGSFEGWSGLVRAAVAWVGLPDPGATRQELVERADTEAQALQGLLAGWEEIDPAGAGVTASQALKALKADPDQYGTLRAVLAEAFELSSGDLPSAQRLGKMLRRFAGRVAGGRCFAARPGHGGVTVWSVRPAGRDGPGGGSGGSGGSVSPHPGACAGAGARTGVRSNTPTTPTIPTLDAPSEVHWEDLPA
jgi:hypothetical protein